MQTHIACGDIAGQATEGRLEIQLDELDGSGFSGQAALEDNNDGTTTVTVELENQTSTTTS